MARTLSTLVVQVQVNTQGAQAAFGGLTATVTQFGTAFEGVSSRTIALGGLMERAFFGIFNAAKNWLSGLFTDAIRTSNEFNNALIGLTSVARAFGISSDAATNAARQLSADGLLPLKDSALGLKNLLMTGFNLEQSIGLMNAFKDSATFARQSTLEFGYAVSSATEGLKNSMPRLMDNAGITKNLSVILAEAGMQLKDLQDATKGATARQVAYVGILREAAAMQGDAARSLNTYTGAMTAATTAYKSLLASVGDMITRNATVMIVVRAVGEALRWVTEQLRDNSKGFYLVSDALIFLVQALSATLKAVDLLQRGFHTFDSAVRLVVFGIAGALSDIAKMLLEVVYAAAKIPGSGIAIAQMGNSIADLMIIATEGPKVMRRMEEAIAANDVRTKSWSSGLSFATGKLDALGKEMVASRGKTIDLGDASRKAGEAIDRTGDAAARAGKKMKDWRDNIPDPGSIKSGWEFFANVGDKIALSFDDANKKVWELNHTLYGFDAREIAENYVNAVGPLKNLQKISLEQQKKINDAMEAAIDSYQRFGQVAPEAMRDLYIATVGTLKVTEGLGDLLRSLPEVDLGQSMKELGKDLTDHLTPMRDVFKRFGEELPDLIFGALIRGDSVIGAALGGLSHAFSDQIKKMLEDAAEEGRKLTGDEKQVGLIGTALGAGLGGFDVGRAQGKAAGLLGGAAGGAAAGLPLAAATGGLSVAIGAIAGGLAGLFGGMKKDKEIAKNLADAKNALKEQFGGMEKLTKLADKLGVSLQGAFNAKKPEQFEDAVKKLNAAIEDQKKRMEALDSAVAGVNARTAIFAQQFAKAFAEKDTAKLAEIAQRAQPEFERLGLIIRDTFAGVIRETGNAYDAITRLAPSFKVLQQGVDDFGLASTAVIDELLANFRLINDEALKPFFEQIQADGQILRGLFDAKALSPEGFQAIAADIGQSIQSIVERGGDMARTLALSQPVLQTLWEAQQRYGLITDETTQSILTQAEKQGLVGAQMKSVNEKILDVLLAIGKVLGADLPDYFRKLVPPAQAAAQGIEDAFSGVEVDPIDIPYRYVPQNAPLPGGGPEVPELGTGAIVRRPTLAVVGEKGPEAVVPLSGGGLGVSGNYVTNIYLDGERIARSTAKKMPYILRDLGIGA